MDYPNDAYYLQCSDGVRALFQADNGLYAVDMLTTLLDPYASPFVQSPHIFNPAANNSFYAVLFDTPWYFTQTGEPHLVTFSSLSTTELKEQGMALNTHYRSSFPLGISLNVVSIIDNRSCEVTTFERGVLRITASCGSGSTSSAVLAFHLGKLSHQLLHIVTSGGMLRIIIKDSTALKIGPAHIDYDNPSFITLEG